MTYHAIDLTGLQRDDPDAYGRLLREVMDQVRAGRFEVLPRHVFSLSEAPGAFRLMLQRRHIGKVVLSFAPRPPEVYCVRRGPAFRRLDKHLYVVNPGRAADYAALLAALESESAAVGRVAHLWNVTAAGRGPSLEKSLDDGFFSLTWLAQALASRGWTQPIDLAVVSTGVQQVAGETRVQPAKATLHGPCRVIPRELPNVRTRSIDVPFTAAGGRQRGAWFGSCWPNSRPSRASASWLIAAPTAGCSTSSRLLFRRPAGARPCGEGACT